MSSLLTPTESRPAFFRTISSNSHQSSRSSKSLVISRTFSHQKDKPRLYLALFPRGGATGGSYGSQQTCDSHHWAFIIGPKSPLRTEAGTVYHVVHSGSDFVSTPLYYEETDLTDSPHHSRNVLARIALAKIVDEQRVIDILRSLAPTSRNFSASASQASSDSDDLSSLSCLSWAKSAWESLSGDSQKPLKSYFGPGEWASIESRTRKYIKRKRVQGRYQANIEPALVTWNTDEICTWNYWGETLHAIHKTRTNCGQKIERRQINYAGHGRFVFPLV